MIDIYGMSFTLELHQTVQTLETYSRPYSEEKLL